MKLVLFRHGLAVDKDEFTDKKMSDALRPLVPKGRERTRLMADQFKARELSPQIIVTSPLVRARQTAEILAQVLKPKQFLECVELAPSAPPQSFAQWLKLHSQNVDTIIAVGHEPQLTIFASWCLSGEYNPFIELKKSGAIGLEFESFSQVGPRTAILNWHVTPKLI